MSIEEVVVTETAALAQAYPLIQPSGITGPCIVYQMISDPPLHMASYVRPRVQLACWASSYAAACALERQVWQKFEGRHVTVGDIHYRSQVLNRLDGNPDLDTGRYCRIVDVQFSYRYT